MSDLENFRREIDHFMGDHPQSPLEHDARHDFKGLNYYDPNPDLIIEVEVERFEADEPIVVMQTSTGDTQQYRRWGQFTFEVDGQEATLVIFSDAMGHDFFMPFKDATNGSETYGAGRYLDNQRPGMERLGPNRFEIDFNYAYNPYCAYSEYYSCPLPPRDNWLKVPIRAGEKKYEK
jgi:hypothetical protein